ncbi:canalicular multispecific organic anion transporter, putative [Entamoeba invadens IP1]|uniref:Canalicular multispecific organic anion transporter, putative n=1 Tax=Entamoeba invadens IP1 TaxID=370355 RepID=A0A0A1UAJ8_ENTIV|nr:canalicular multispecific organic anion transporter, putative [Entamoeba invadens IP1]ELP92088.1 canalicular multispecific organic anion transporter, putative [Entamoeba invadens IP1]|eukprot:XP_004258859.1 canalicular multispecific organic anion transporter, putative [Entamoeba invadens IP1]
MQIQTESPVPSAISHSSSTSPSPSEVEMQVVEVDEGYKEEEIEPIYKKHPNCCQILLMQRAPKYISKGRKGSLNVKEIGQIPSTLNIEKTHEKFTKCWETEMLKHPKSPSLLRALFRMEWKQLLLCILAMFISQLSTLIMPVLIQFMTRWVSEENPKTYVGVLYLLGIAALQVITSFCFQMSIKWMFVLSLRLRNGLIAMIYAKSLKLNSASIEETGKLVNLMSNDAMLFVEQLPLVISGGTAPLLFLIVCIILLVLITYWALIPIGVCLLFVVINMISGRFIGFFFNLTQHATDNRLNFLGEILRSIKFIKYNAWEKPLNSRLHKLRNKELFAMVGTNTARASLVTMMLELTSLMAFVLYLVLILLKKKLDVGTVFACIAYFNCIRVPFMNFGYFISSVSMFKVSIGRMEEFFLTPELQKQDRSTTTQTDYAVDMKDVRYVFPNGETAFSCDNLKIKKGELVCVLGSVGSGKSSLLMSILGELELKEGETKVSGELTYASQTAWMMNTTVRENIIFLDKFDRTRYNKACTCACLNRDLQILRGGDLYEVAERGSNLSGGQRQRISIARALYNAKDIVMFDDPLSAVDFQVGSFIFENAMEGLLSGKTRIIVTNQTYFIDKADRIIVIEDKKIAFNGTIDELRNSNISAAEIVKTVTKKKENKKKEDTETVPQDVVATEVIEEKRSVGGVAWSTYFRYFSAGGFFWLFLLIVPFILRCGTRICYNLFLTWWTNQIDEEHPQGDTYWFYASDIALGVGILSIFISMVCISLYGLLCANGLHKMMVKNLFGTLLSFFDVTPLGRLLNYFSRDLRFVDSRLPQQYEQFFGQTCDLIAIFVVICTCSYYLIIVVVFILVAFMCFHKYFVRSSIEMQRLEGITRSPMFIHFDQTLLGLSTVRTYGGAPTFLEAIIKKMKNNTLSYYTLQMAKSWYSQRLDWLGIILAVATVTGIVIMKVEDSIDSGVAGVALMNIATLGGFITVFSQNVLEVEIVMQSVERVLVLRDTPVEDTKEKKAKYTIPPDNWPVQGKIELDNYQFKYREGLPLVLKGVSAVIHDKEKIGVVGRTGSGKSTMMAGLFRIEEPAGGCIKVDGIDTTTVPLEILRSRMCILPQEATMFSGNIRDNLDPTHMKSDEEMKRVLQLVKFEKDLDYQVTENGENFSLGERQMLCMARALLRGAKILIMDEATASIDIQTDIMIQEMVRKNFTQCTVLTIAHRLHSIMDSNKVMVFDDGHLMEMDTPINLINNTTTIFNNLVQQSGCPDELTRLAKGETSIAETLKNTEHKDEAHQEHTETLALVEKENTVEKSDTSSSDHSNLVDLKPINSPMPVDCHIVEKTLLNKSSSD